MREIDEHVRACTTLGEASKSLEVLLVGGYAVAPDGTLLSIRQRVGAIGAIGIHIYAREHAPPHFHVKAGSVDAVFRLDNCEHLSGGIDRKSLDIVRWWYERSRGLLIQTWNDTRPAGCQVGPLNE
jgi:hypothetical protein